MDDCRWALEATTDCVLLLDAGFRVVYANRRAADLNDTVPESLVGRLHGEVWPQTAGSEVERRYREVVRTGLPTVFEHHYLSDAGQGTWHEIHASPHGGGVAVFFRDLTPEMRRQAEAKARLEALLAAADIGSWLLDVAQDTVAGDAKALAMFGLDARPGEPIPADRFRASIPPEDRETIRTSFRAAVLRGGVWNVDYRIVRDDSVRWINARGVPEFNAEGRPVRVPGVAVDVTAIKEAEERERALNAELDARVQARTAELQRANEELQAFTSAVSHDLRGPLRNIHGLGQMLLEDAADRLTESDRRLLDRQAHNATRLAAMVDALLGLARLGREPLNAAPFDLTALAESVRDEFLARDAYGECRIEVAPGLRAFGDRRLVRSVLLNLLENACKFSPDGGTVRVGQGEESAFFVSDEGVGFDMAYSAKLFQPFERLVSERQFPGTGIGLANVRRIVERHGGRVWAESAPGQGATFRFMLPGGE